MNATDFGVGHKYCQNMTKRGITAGSRGFCQIDVGIIMLWQIISYRLCVCVCVCVCVRARKSATLHSKFSKFSFENRI